MHQPTALAGRLLLLISFFAPISFAQSPPHPANYEIHLDFHKPLSASVTATLPVGDGSLFTADPSGGYEWDRYIKNVRLLREDGSNLPLPSTDRNHWKLPAGALGQIRLQYEVNLTFTDTGRIEPGSQRGGQFFGDSLYLVNRALFVMSNAAGPREIHFDVPAGFEIATPWEKLTPRTFRARDNGQLADNTTVFGRFPSFHIRESKFDLTFVMPGSSPASQALLEPALRSILREYLRIFPDTPEFRVVLSYFRGPEENGEAYQDSGAMTSVDAVSPENRILWANYLAHEIFHHWNGNMIVGKDRGRDFGTTDWFSEGATEYVANRTLVRSGVISPELFFKKMEINMGMYVYWNWAPPFQKTSLSEAGGKAALPAPEGTIAKTYNRPGVYSGGWVAAFCLDTLIQKRTGGKRNLDDLFRSMQARFGSPGKEYTLQDLKNVASEIADQDLTEYFSRYIESPESLPVKQCLSDAGFDAAIIDYGGEVFLRPATQPSPSALAIRNRLLTGKP